MGKKSKRGVHIPKREMYVEHIDKSMPSRLIYGLLALLVLTLGFFAIQNYSEVSVGKAYQILVDGATIEKEATLNVNAFEPKTITLIVNAPVLSAAASINGNAVGVSIKISENTIYSKEGTLSISPVKIPDFSSQINQQCLSYPCNIKIGITSKSDGIVTLRDFNILTQDDNAVIRVETEKEEYEIGEIVALKGLESIESSGGSTGGGGGSAHSITGAAVYSEDSKGTKWEGMLSTGGNEVITPEGILNKKDFGIALEYHGYIIEFKEKPILIIKNEIQNKIEEQKKEILRLKKDAQSDVSGGASIDVSAVEVEIRRLEKSLPNIVGQQENRINSLHERLRKDISNFAVPINSIAREENDEGSKSIVIGEYKKVFSGAALDISDKEAMRLKELDYVKEVYPNYVVNITLMDSAPLIGADDVWHLDDDGNDCSVSGKQCLTGEGITIGIIDTGVDYTHQDLGGCLGAGCKVTGGYDFVNEDDDPIDDHFHGTHVAATAAGNGILKGIAPDAKIVAYKVLDSGGGGHLGNIIGAIERSVDPNQDGDYSDHLDIISLSLGGWGNPDDPQSTAIDNAVDSGVVAVISAGNAGPRPESIGSPGTARQAITIGATYKKDYDGFWLNCDPEEKDVCGDIDCDEDGRIWCEQYWRDILPRKDQIVSFSSRGPVVWKGGLIIKPDIVAPGALICAARYDSVFPEGKDRYYKPCLDEQHVELAGTSMATPIVSGAVALLKQKNPNWTPDEIKIALRNTAADLGYDTYTQGYGRLDVLAAVQLDNAPPIAIISDPGKIHGTEADILGKAASDDFVGYILYYGRGTDISGIEWSEICSSTNQVSNGALCNWDIRALDDGLYALKLVVNSQNQESVDYAFANLVNTEITKPKDLKSYEFGFSETGKIIPNWKNMVIEGTSAGFNFDHYTLEWCLGNSCSSDGITLTNDGSSPVLDNVLGIWDVSSLEESNFYSIKLITYYAGKQEVDQNKIYIATDLQEGWPIVSGIDGGGGIAFASLDQPTIEDIDNNGKKDLVTAYSNIVNVLAHDAKPLNGWPKEVKTSCGYEAKMQVGPAVADLDNDGFNEIAIGDNCGYFHIFNHDGTYVDGWPKNMGCFYYTTPAISDINKDGNLDIIVGDWCSYLRVFDANGIILSKYIPTIDSYPYFRMVIKSPSVADLDNDGYDEIVAVSSGCNQGGSCGHNELSTRIWALNHDGTDIDGWPKDFSFGGTYESNTIFADLDNDNKLEIITGSGDGFLYAWNANGRWADGFPVDTPLMELKEPAVGDIDNDGSLEIVITGESDTNDLCLIAYEGNGAIVKNFPVCRDGYKISSNLGGAPAIANIDNDDEYEIIVTADGGSTPADDGYLARFYAVNHDGTIVNGFPKMLDDFSFGNIAPVGDLDNDGDDELIISTWSGTNYVYDLPGVARDEWPVYQHDSRHTGLYTPLTGTPPPPAKKPISMLENLGKEKLSGTLTLKVQQFLDDTWVDERVVYEASKELEAKEIIDLSGLWENAGSYIASKSGSFRVYAEFKYNDNVIFDYYQFNVEAEEIGGDAWKVGTSKNMLEISEELREGTNREPMRNIVEFISKPQLNALSSGTASNSKGDAGYNQYLSMPQSSSGIDTGYVIYAEDNNDVTADFLYFKSGTEIGTYLLEFTTPFKSGIYDENGHSTKDGDYLIDYKRAEMSIFGKKYSIVEARRNGAKNAQIKLILMGGVLKDTLNEGETKSYTIYGKEYSVTLDLVDKDSAKFTVNDETIDELMIGEIGRLSDGLVIGVSDILYDDYAGGVHNTEFFLGAQKLELKDDDVTDTKSSSNLNVNGEQIENAFVIIEGSDDDITFSINKIHVSMKADDDFYLATGGKLSQNPDMDEPEVLFTSNWDIEYKGLKEEPIEIIEIENSGFAQYNLRFNDGYGNLISLPIAEAVGDSLLEFGENDKALVNVEKKAITKDDYLVLTDSSKLRGERKTYVLQYKGADKVTSDNPMLKFKDLGSGVIIEQPYTDATPLAVLTIGRDNVRFAVYKSPNADISINDFDIQVDLDADGTLETSREYIPITTLYGAEIVLTNEMANRVDFSVKTPDDERDENAKDSVDSLQATDISGYITASSGIVGIQRTGNLLFRSLDSVVSHAYTSYGAFITYDAPAAGPSSLKIEYPEKQREALVYYTAEGEAKPCVDSDGACIVGFEDYPLFLIKDNKLNAILVVGDKAPAQDILSVSDIAFSLKNAGFEVEVGATKLASEVENPKAQNMILVGRATAYAGENSNVLMDYFEIPELASGQSLLKIAKNNGHYAIVVTGREIEDTRKAAVILAAWKDNSNILKGLEVIIGEIEEMRCETTFDCPAFRRCENKVCVGFCENKREGSEKGKGDIEKGRGNEDKEAGYKSAVSKLNSLGYDVIGNAEIPDFEIKKADGKIMLSSESEFHVFDQALDSFVLFDSKGNQMTVQKRKSNQLEKRKPTHIVEFREKPLLAVKSEAEREFGIKEAEARSAPKNIKEKIEDKLKRHEQRLVRAKEAAIKEMLEINPGISSRITSTYKNVFNGVAAELMEDEVPKIKLLPSVKNVYRNEEVNVVLEDSVNQINADEVWKLLDKDGNAITGKDVTIGIIDTGVDYSHADLGSSVLHERNFERITEKSLDIPFDSYLELNGVFAYNNNRVAYPSNNKIKIYSFKDKETREIGLFSENLAVLRIALDGNILAYIADNSDGNAAIYYLNLDTNAHLKVVEVSDIGLLAAENNRLIYGREGSIYVYDIEKGEEKLIDHRFYMPMASDNLVAYPIPAMPGENCYDKAVVYNIETEEKREITPIDVGPILDFEEDKILYAACSKTNFDPTWKTYYLYDINTGESLEIKYENDQLETESAQIKSFDRIVSYISKGSITQDLIFFSKDIKAGRIIAYDRNTGRYVQINLWKLSNYFEAEGNKVCFTSNDKHIYCHDYNQDDPYEIPDGVPFNDKVIDGYDFANNDNDPMDDHGHGTHVAATAAGNGILKGIAPDAKIVAYKVLDAAGSGSFDDVIQAIERSVDPNQDGNFDDHLDIISLSLGGWGDPDDPQSKAIDNAVDAGVIAVIAAGNSGPFPNTIGSPGTARKAITIGAVDKCDLIAEFSSRGPVSWEGGILLKPDVVAPGVSICAAQFNGWLSESRCKDDSHIAISGTSMATPHVSGAAALLLQAHPEWKPDTVKSALMTTAMNLGLNHAEQGMGRVNILASNNAKIATNPQSISFSFKIGEQRHKEAIIVKNLEDKTIKIITKVAELRDDEGNFYTFASVNVSELTIEANSQEDIGFIVDIPNNIDGVFEGLITISYNGDDYKIPIIFEKFSRLTIKATSKETKLYPSFLIHNKNLDIAKHASYGFKFMGDSFTFKVPSDTYTAYAIGDFDSGFDYILSNIINIPFDSEVSSELKIENARPFTVKAESLQGAPLKLYDWSKGLNTYNDDKLVSTFHYGTGIGNKIIYLSNKPDNELNTDIFVFFNGVPAIEEGLHEKLEEDLDGK